MTDRKDALTDLLTRVIDSADGYEQAAASAKSGALKSMFEERAGIRRKFASELRGELVLLGEDVDDDGSLLAAAHREFLELKSMLGDDNERVLEEVERGESVLVDQYNETLEALPADSTSRKVIEAQLDRVRRDLQSVERLEEAVD